MKFKKTLLIFTLLLSIILIGAVSAADDTGLNEELEIDQNTQETISQETDELIEQEESNNALEDQNEEPPFLYVLDYVNVDQDFSTIASVTDWSDLNGTVTTVIDDDVYIKSYSIEDDEQIHSLIIRDLKEIPSYGPHKVNVTYQKNGVETPFNLVKTVEFTYHFTINGMEESDIKKWEIYYGNDLDVDYELPEDCKGILTLTFNSKKYTIKVGKYNTGNTIIPSNKLKLGEYVLEAQFKDSNNKYPVKTLKIPVAITPNVYYPWNFAKGEKNVVSIEAHQGSQLTATLYKIDEGTGKLTKLAKVSGKTYVEIPVSKLVKGYALYLLNYTADGQSYSLQFDSYAENNDKKVQASFTKKGDSVTVSVTGPESYADFNIYLDNNLVKSASLKNGKLKYTISKLTVGKHKIRITHFGDYVYLNTYWVSVTKKDKVSLSLKKVNVKRSAKKLVLKATLKYDHKFKKGLKVTFKFKNKKLTAKTNSKGIAKVTIPKKILKKLKVGKKVTYKVAYGGKTVKKTVKVKR